MHIPDPVELMESRMDREMAKVDDANTYPCIHCERRFVIDTMQQVSADPGSPLECGRDDCEPYRERQIEDAEAANERPSYYP
jgi:hypothetical protein